MTPDDDRVELPPSYEWAGAPRLMRIEVVSPGNDVEQWCSAVGTPDGHTVFGLGDSPGGADAAAAMLCRERHRLSAFTVRDPLSRLLEVVRKAGSRTPCLFYADEVAACLSAIAAILEKEN